MTKNKKVVSDMEIIFTMSFFGFAAAYFYYEKAYVLVVVMALMAWFISLLVTGNKKVRDFIKNTDLF